MASYLRLSSIVVADGGALDAVQQAISTAAQSKEREEFAASKIQATHRMFAQRRRFLRTRTSVTDIQRCFRGYRGRKHFLRERIAQQLRFNSAVLDHFATVIQSRFRGYLLRKHQCNFYARKRYLEEVTQEGERIRAEAQRTFEAQQEWLEETRRAAQLAEFKKVTESMHHLLSTASISGVYRPPLAVDGCKTVFGTNIEDDLRAIPHGTTKRKFKPDLPGSTAPSGEMVVRGDGTKGASSASGSMLRSAQRVPHAPVGWNPSLSYGNVSLQNAAPFQAEAYYEALDKAVSKKLEAAIHGNERFFPRKVEPKKFESTITAESPFVERSALASRKR